MKEIFRGEKSALPVSGAQGHNRPYRSLAPHIPPPFPMISKQKAILILCSSNALPSKLLSLITHPVALCCLAMIT